MNSTEALARARKDNSRRSDLLQSLQAMVDCWGSARMGGWMTIVGPEEDIRLSQIASLTARLIGGENEDETREKYAKEAIKILQSSPVAKELPQFLPAQTPFTPHYILDDPSDLEVRLSFAGNQGDPDYDTYVKKRATDRQWAAAKEYYAGTPEYLLRDEER